MMDPDTTKRGALTGEVRLRVPLPIIVPLGALAVIAIAAIGFSRILLSVPKEIATLLAIVTAANVLGACAVLAAKRNTDRSFLSELAIVVLYPVIVGAVIATMNLDEAGHAEPVEHPANGGAPPAGEFTEEITAAGSAFVEGELTLPASETHELTFVNEDSVPHNLAIYEEEGGPEIFVGDPVTGGDTTYSIEGPGEPLEAYFQCDIHPTMNGTATFK